MDIALLAEFVRIASFDFRFQLPTLQRGLLAREQQQFVAADSVPQLKSGVAAEEHGPLVGEQFAEHTQQVCEFLSVSVGEFVRPSFTNHHRL